LDEKVNITDSAPSEQNILSSTGLNELNSRDINEKASNIVVSLADFALANKLVVSTVDPVASLNGYIASENCCDIEYSKQVDTLEEQSQVCDTETAGILANTQASTRLAQLKDDHVQCRIKDLQNQVNILEHNDLTFSDTIEALEDIELELKASIINDSQTDTLSAKGESEMSQETTDKLCMLDKQQLFEGIQVVKKILTDFVKSRELGTSAFEKESRDMVKESLIQIKQRKADFEKQITAEFYLDKQILLLDASRSTEFHDEKLEARFSSIIESGSQLLTKDSVKVSNLSSSHRKEIESLRNCAMDAVIVSFRKDFEELKSFTELFLSITDVYEEITACDLIEPSSPLEETKDQSELVAAKSSLKLNTDLFGAQQSFGFLSPTTFGTDWPGGSHLEVKNYCLHLQLHDLEKERDCLKELLCRDEGIISEQRIQIAKLESSEQRLQKSMECLEIFQQQAHAKVCDLESSCAELQLSVNQMQSNASSLKLQLESSENNEYQLKMQLQTACETHQNNEAKLKMKILNLEGDKCDLEKHAEELAASIESLEARESGLRQRIKYLESSESSLQEKFNEQEFVLNAAYDEAGRINKQKNSLAQKVHLLEAGHAELRQEMVEWRDECSRLAAENSRLAEEENFLKEANRKMWLSLQAHLKGLDGNRENENQDIPFGAVTQSLLSASPPSHSSDEEAQAAQRALVDADVESADEASEIHDEDDGATSHSNDVTTPRYTNVMRMMPFSGKRAGFRRRAQSAVVTSETRGSGEASGDVFGMNVGLSVESVADSGLDSLSERVESKERKLLDGVSQTEVMLDCQLSDGSVIASLRLELEEKDKYLQTMIEEVGRLTLQMRYWQDKVASEMEQATHLASTSEKNSNSLPPSQQPKKSRLEPYTSQIPVSIRRCRSNFGADLKSSSANGSVTTETPEESVHVAGSSLSQKTTHSFTSHIPRPIGDRGLASLAKPQDESADSSDNPSLDYESLASVAAAAAVEGAAPAAVVAALAALAATEAAEACSTKAPSTEGQGLDV
jgi:hypothetical protein